jgi:hypothetical protein
MSISSIYQAKKWLCAYIIHLLSQAKKWMENYVIHLLSQGKKWMETYIIHLLSQSKKWTLCHPSTKPRQKINGHLYHPSTKPSQKMNGHLYHPSTKPKNEWISFSSIYHAPNRLKTFAWKGFEFWTHDRRWQRGWWIRKHTSFTQTRTTQFQSKLCVLRARQPWRVWCVQLRESCT